MTTNLTNFSGANNFLDLSVAVNNSVNGLYFPVILAILYIVVLINTMQYGGTQSFFVSSFVTFVISSFLWSVGLLTEAYLIIFFSLFVISALAFTAMR